MPEGGLGWLAAGFGAAWVLIAAYLLRLWVAQRRLRREVEQLGRRGR